MRTEAQPLRTASATNVAEAHDAFASWRRVAPRTRGDPAPACDLVLARRDGLAMLMTLEMGKPLSESLGEVGYAADFT